MTLLVFFLIRMVPGDPIETLAGERGVDPVRHAALLKEYGLDRPIMVQYGIYILRVVQGDLGRSMITHAPVLKEFKTLFPATVELGVCAILFALIQALEQGWIAGAGLDVYASEPLDAQDPLCRLEQVVLSPHLGYATRENYAAFYANAVAQVRDWIADHA